MFRSFRLAVALALIAGLPAVAGAQVNMTALQTRVVRIVVGSGPDAQAASGFLWMRLNQVVTSLHTFSYRTTDTPNIRVSCKGTFTTATVTRVLADADLVLLTTTQNLEGCDVFNPTHVQLQKPDPFTSLFTWGFHAGATGGTSRKMEKGSADPERLDDLLQEPVRSAIGNGGIPDLRLPIYYVQGGLLPGYSGAPVIDANNRLVGIVEGGLDSGASAYNWVIPAENLQRLVVSRESLPPRGFIKGAAHFSSPFIEADTTLRQAKSGDSDKALYEFVKTKTLSLRQLAGSSSTPDEFNFLLELGAGLGLNKATATNQTFDVYEDVRKKLIIAIPTGQQAVFEPPRAAGAGVALRAGAPDRRDGDLLFQEYPTQSFVPNPATPIQSPEFAKTIADGQLNFCVREFTYKHTCEILDSDVTTFANGSRKFTYIIMAKADPSTRLQDVLEYKSLAVQGARTFYASAQIRILPSGNLNLRQFANLAAVQVSTIGGAPAPVNAAAANARPTNAPNAANARPRPAAPAPNGVAPLSGRLAEGKWIRVGLPALRVGPKYEISGECDDNCTDLDLEVIQNDAVLDSDEEDDDVPMVELTPQRGGLYYVKVMMESCDAATCEWRLTIKPK